MIIRIHKNNGLGTVLLFYAIVSTLLYCLPILKYSISYIPQAIVLLFSYILFLLLNKENSEFVVAIIVISLVLGLLEFAISSGGSFVAGINEFVRSLRFMAPLLVFIMMNKYCTRRQIAKYSLFATTLFLFVMYKTNIAINEIPTISRILATGLSNDEALYPYRMQNIGGFEFCYAMGFVVVIALYVASNKNNTIIKKIVSLCIFAASIIFVFKTQYMILLMLTACFSVIFLYLNSKHGLNRLAATVGCIVLICFIPTILSSLSSAGFSSTLQAKRFDGFMAVFRGGSLLNTSSRFEKYINSFIRFLGSPIWGRISADNQAHSTFFGVLETKGIIGFGAWFILLEKANAYLKCEIQNRYGDSVSNSALLNTMFFMLLVLAVFNPIQYCFEVCFVVYLIMPCVVSTFSTEVK